MDDSDFRKRKWACPEHGSFLGKRCPECDETPISIGEYDRKQEEKIRLREKKNPLKIIENLSLWDCTVVAISFRGKTYLINSGGGIVEVKQ
jgi:hypothetical protein